VSVDRHEHVPAGRAAHHGLVTELALAELDRAGRARPRLVLACGPTPLLRAAALLARDRGWPCQVSLEEHMGCGYGVCKGCVVPVRLGEPGSDSWRNANSCTEGPVFDAELIDWERFGAHHATGGAA
jgi:dihydroorotate dehydrogenase electron transfer subunit